jgi:hypothetical protein
MCTSNDLFISLTFSDGSAWFPKQTDGHRLGSKFATDDHRHGIRSHQSVSFSFVHSFILIFSYSLALVLLLTDVKSSKSLNFFLGPSATPTCVSFPPFRPPGLPPDPLNPPPLHRTTHRPTANSASQTDVTSYIPLPSRYNIFPSRLGVTVFPLGCLPFSIALSFSFFSLL